MSSKNYLFHQQNLDVPPNNFFRFRKSKISSQKRKITSFAEKLSSLHGDAHIVRGHSWANNFQDNRVTCHLVDWNSTSDKSVENCRIFAYFWMYTIPQFSPHHILKWTLLVKVNCIHRTTSYPVATPPQKKKADPCTYCKISYFYNQI